jgi:acyl-CoA synthetase (AMP-forming)/AMP-acid ligase II/aryl carrier-like protein
MIAKTLNELMERNRQVARSITYHNGENDSHAVSFAELHKRALGILWHLQQMGARPGDKLILFLASNEQFIDVFWAAVLGGIIPVPVAIGISDEHRHKLLRIARKLGSPFLYTDRRSQERIGAFAAQSSDASDATQFAALGARTFVVENLQDISRPGTPHAVQPEDTAFIQFSSGSTSEPKGVVLTHANLIANIDGSTQAAGFNENDVSLSWMPLTHDMGLIGFHLVMFANHVHSHLMPTELFVRRPLLWLAIASQYRATILCSPNFGYRHYLKVLGDRSPGNLDLSAVRLIFNGAEPISVELCEEFLARLGSVGLKHNAMFPVYGLAEASLAVSFPPVGRPYRATYLNRHKLAVGETAEVLTSPSRDALGLVSVGNAIPFCELRIANDAGEAMPDGRVGHILIRGENVTHGYFEEPAVNAATITADGWLRTGDLGIVSGGEVYITGRAKEILFVNGQNYYPHDLESVAQRAQGMELGKVVVAGVRPPGAETDQLVVFLLHRGELKEFVAVSSEAARLINEHTGLEVAEVVPVKRIPKTTSGKIQRHLLEQEYLDGKFAAELAELATLRGAQAALPAGGADALEAQLLKICNSVLTTRPIGANDNLFEIGVSSLKLIEIHELIDREYPGQIDLTEIFDHPTVADMARFLTSKLNGAAT